MSDTCFVVKDLDLVFGAKPHRAFQLLDEGKTREEIQERTSLVVGVHGASFTVRRGEIFALMGLSGSGKSSLLRCLNGMNGRGVGVMRGTVQYLQPQKKDGDKPIPMDIGRCSEGELRNLRRHSMAMVFQQIGLMPWRTVLENVTYPLEIQGVQASERINRALEKIELVGLASWRDRYPKELSGGMQQRVGLARAFVTDAEVLFMDEPFSALDSLHRRQLQNEILELQSKLRKTILFVTHDFAEASRIANRVAILDSGKVLQLATPQELSTKPAEERVRQLTC